MKRQTASNILRRLVSLGLSTLIMNTAFVAQSSITTFSIMPGYPPLQAVQLLPSSPPPLLTSVAPTSVRTEQPSQAAQKALAYLSQREGIPLSSLVIATDHGAEYTNTERKFQVVTLLDTRPGGKFYDLLVDLSTGNVIEDIASIWAAEDHAGAEKYGKLDQDLFERLQTMQDNDIVTVMIWVIPGSGQSLTENDAVAIATLTAKYAEARVAVEQGSKPMDVADPVLAERIEKEFVEMLNANVAQRVRPLVEALKVQGLDVQTSIGLPVALLHKWIVADAKIGYS